jgi:uncharacterized protein
MNILPLVAITAPWVASRIVKLIIDSKSGSAKASTDYIFKDGGMPSNHTALVFGLATTILLEDGISLLFMASAILAFIVAHDAMKIRREAGKHATLLNELFSRRKSFEKLNERLGHNFKEVLAGAALGIALPAVIYILAA